MTMPLCARLMVDVTGTAGAAALNFSAAATALDTILSVTKGRAPSWTAISSECGETN